MPVRDLLLPELELEASFTRKHLERVPMNTLGQPAQQVDDPRRVATFTPCFRRGESSRSPPNRSMLRPGASPFRTGSRPLASELWICSIET